MNENGFCELFRGGFRSHAGKRERAVIKGPVEVNKAVTGSTRRRRREVAVALFHWLVVLCCLRYLVFPVRPVTAPVLNVLTLARVTA